MDRRSFLWTSLAALLGAGCTPRAGSGFAPSEAGEALWNGGTSPAGVLEAKAIFKEVTGTAWSASAPNSTEESRWIGNAATDAPTRDTDAPPSAAKNDAPSAAADAPAARPQPERQKDAPKPANPMSGPRARIGDVRRAVNGVMTVHPGEVLQFEAQGYCLDPDRPAPSAGEPMRFVPMAGLINFRLRRLFSSVLRMAGKQNTSHTADFQNVVWAIRTADAKHNSWGDALGPAEKRLLNAAMPGGAALLQQVRRTATGRAEGGQGLAPLVPGVNFSADSRLHLDQLFRQTPSGGMPHGDAQFSMLSAGVAGRAENLGRLRVRWQIANSSAHDFAFDSTQWALEPQRKVQREALPPPSQAMVIKA